MRFSLFGAGWLSLLEEEEGGGGGGDVGEVIETGKALLDEGRFVGARLALDPGTWMPSECRDNVL